MTNWQAATAFRIDRELDHFQWATPGRDGERGTITVDYGSWELLLEVWCQDNDGDPTDPTFEELKPLTVRVPLTNTDPRLQIRDIIHKYLCHEADEQMWFGDERPFHPHLPART